jgi:hypothetical protein
LHLEPLGAEGAQVGGAEMICGSALPLTELATSPRMGSGLAHFISAGCSWTPSVPRGLGWEVQG